MSLTSIFFNKVLNCSNSCEIGLWYLLTAHPLTGLPPIPYTIKR